MAAEVETARKRFREEEAEWGDPKRQCSLNNILSLLESEEEEPTEDLSSIITTLQLELSSSSSYSSDPAAESGGDPPPGTAEQGQVNGGEEEEEEEVVVMKHLLEASDDELGLPSSESGQGGEAEDESGGVGEILGYDGFWEFEDEAANYYTLLQSELFLS